MKTIKKPGYLLFDKHFVVITILALGLVLGVSVLNQRTQTQQHASLAVNLNTASGIDTTINPDWTMGPKTAADNFSNLLPNPYLGSLEIKIKDSNATGGSTNLKLTITKAEAHLVHLFIPGAGNVESDMGDGGQKTNQNVNKWETLDLKGHSGPVSVDLAGDTISSIGTTRLAGGKYSEIRLYLSEAKATQSDGKELRPTMPGHSNVIRLVNTFDILGGRTTQLTIDVDGNNSLIKEGDVYFLLPYVIGVNASN